MKARLPLLVFTVIYCALIMPRFTPDRLAAGTAGGEARNDAGNLRPFSEIAGIVIFFGTALALMLQAYAFRFLAIWQICITGAVLMVICGVLKPAQACKAIPVSMLLLIIGALAMSGALSGTGAGNLIGGIIAIIQSSKANDLYNSCLFTQDPGLRQSLYLQSEAKNKSARTWIWISVLTGLIPYLCLLVVFLVAGAEAFADL
jgi:hypothetical protein